MNKTYSVLFMFGLTLFFATVVSGVKYLQQDRIELNEKVKLRKVVLRVLGLTGGEEVRPEEIFQTFEQQVQVLDIDGLTVYRGTSADGALAGYAFPTGGAGFWGPINGMVAVDARIEHIIGLDFYRHAETPGLGARISEKWFTKQFSGLNIRRAGERPVFRLQPPGGPPADGGLDAVTGATQTSRAVERFLNADLGRIAEEYRKVLEERYGHG